MDIIWLLALATLIVAASLLSAPRGAHAVRGRVSPRWRRLAFLTPVTVLMAVSIAACGTTPGGGFNLTPSAQVVAAQGDTALDLAYNVAAKAYLKALPTLSPDVKAKVKPALVKAYALVQATDRGEQVAGATSLADQVAQAGALIASVRTALGLP